MNEDILRLATLMRSNKRAYALLIGSGVSRSAQIPTGWEMACSLRGKDFKDVNEDKIMANFSQTLSSYGKTPEERSGLIKHFFEPTDDERKKGQKIPQIAHKIIANFVKEGVVKFIITTNFDPLIEDALYDEYKIKPVIIKTENDVNSVSSPITSNDCFLIKVNGDYKYTNIKITNEELIEIKEPLYSFLKPS